jgi:glutaredoxin
MKFTIYSKNDCPYCYKVKQVLDLCGKDFVVYTLDVDFNREQFYNEFGEGATFPQVVADDKHIGGCNDTILYLKELSVI